MQGGEVWAGLLNVVAPTVGLWLALEVIRLLRRKAEQIKDERVRQAVLELVKAAEEMIRGQKAGARRLAIVKELAPPGTTREQIEAAVHDMKAGRR